MSEEIANYIDQCYAYEDETKYKDVYVTDHKAEDKKCTTQGEEEDNEYYAY